MSQAQITEWVTLGEFDVEYKQPAMGDYRVPMQGLEECSKFMDLHYEEHIFDLQYRPLQTFMDEKGCLQLEGF